MNDLYNRIKSHHRARSRSPASGLVIGSPQDIKIAIPRNRNDDNGRPIQPVTRDVDSETMRRGLDHVSTFLAKHGRRIEVVAVGGAVNTLFLHTREKTHDIDIFSSELDKPSRILLDEAAHDAQKRIPALGTDWLNTETEMWMTGPAENDLTHAAAEQNVRLYEGQGLIVYLAPWDYAFTGKVHRIQTGGGNVRDYDLADAAHYMHQYILAHSNRPVKAGMIQEWAKKWRGYEVKASILARIQIEYKRHYGGHKAMDL
ncbi:hypothetical protein QBC37DRAFT_287514 [Rhypophila decipiens]|uniref:DUF7582 domain-containing protein n=1 Tax=Rhypophila decipiens TaxID=261697 RepID=A0AAN6Y6A1_9PEZI|nr:hypothetical protein QBC37DRAFT_287514 [Rhypophila decipiens]